MARFQFRVDPEPTREERWAEIARNGTRAFGVVLILIGMAVALRVIVDAWGLYRHPERIEYFVAAIERGSNLGGMNVSGAPADRTDAASTAAPFRLAYFAAWGVVILLLLLIGRLAITVIRVGGELALHEPKAKPKAVPKAVEPPQQR